MRALIVAAAFLPVLAFAQPKPPSGGSSGSAASFSATATSGNGLKLKQGVGICFNDSSCSATLDYDGSNFNLIAPSSKGFVFRIGVSSALAVTSGGAVSAPLGTFTSLGLRLATTRTIAFNSGGSTTIQDSSGNMLLTAAGSFLYTASVADAASAIGHKTITNLTSGADRWIHRWYRDGAGTTSIAEIRANGSFWTASEIAAAVSVYHGNSGAFRNEATGPVRMQGTATDAAASVAASVGNTTTLSSGTDRYLQRWCRDTPSTCAANMARVTSSGRAEFDGGAILGATGTAIAASVAASVSVDVPSTSAAGCSDVSVSVMGATTGGQCVLGPPATWGTGWLTQCFVTAADTVSVRACRLGGSGDPAAETFYVRVFNN